jgi:WD40 repeat protein
LLVLVVTLAAASLMIWNEQHKTQHALEAALTSQASAAREATRARTLATDVQRHAYARSVRLIQQFADLGQQRERQEQLQAAREFLEVETIPTFAWYYWWHQFQNRELIALPRQQDTAVAVAFTPGGAQFAWLGTQGDVRLWDIATRRMVFSQRCSPGPITILTLSPDGQWLAVAGGPVIFVWDIREGKLVHEFSAQTHGIRALHFQSDNHTLLSVDDTWVANLWNLHSGGVTPASSFGAPVEPKFAWTHDDQRVATVGTDACIRIFAVQPSPDRSHVLQRSVSLPNHVPAAELGFTQDDRELVWVTTDGQVHVLDASSWEVTLRHELPTERIVYADLDAACEKLVTVDEKNVAQVWDVRSARCLAQTDTLETHRCRFSDDGQMVALGGPAGSTAAWLPFARKEAQPRGHAVETWCVAFSPDGRWLASGSDDHTVRIWNTRDGTEHWVLQGHTATVTGVEFSSDGKFVASSSLDGSVKLWQVQDWQEVRTLQGHAKRACCVAFSPNGSLLAAGGDEVLIWETHSGQLVHEFREADRSRINAVQFTPDGSQLAVASNTERVLLLETGTWRVQLELPHNEEVRAIDFAPDGRMLATGDKAGNVSLWNIERGQPVAVQPAHQGYVRAIRFSRDGRTIASAGDDHTIRLWDAADCLEICTLEGHEAEVFALAFAPDDSLLASGSYDGAIRFWHAERQE